MATLRIAAASAAAALAVANGASPQGLCKDAASPMMPTLVGIAPGCFSVCSQLCEPMDAIIDKYTSSMDTSMIKPLICADTEPFKCLYDGEKVKPACKALLEAGSSFGIKIPQSEEELLTDCGEVGEEDGGSRHEDIDAGGDEANSTNATDDNATDDNGTVDSTTTVSGNMISDGASGQSAPVAMIAATVAATVVAGLMSM